MTALRLHFVRFCVPLAGAVLVGMLAACGGAASSPPAPTNTQLLTPSPSPSPNPFPTTSGDAFTYAGTMTQTFTVYGTPLPLPTPVGSPQPTATPWVTTSTTVVAQKTTIESGASFSGQSNLTDLTTNETDTTAHATTSVTDNEYVSLVSDSTRVNGIDVTEAGSTSSESSGVALQSTFAAGNGVIDELPQFSGLTWNNTAARTQSENDPNGDALSSTYNADGSYQEQVTYSAGGNAAVNEYSDGSGIYNMPALGDGLQNSSITVNAPESSGGAESILVSYAIYGTQFPSSGNFTLPVWYPQTPPVLASDAFTNNGQASVPSSCNVPSTYTSSGTIDSLVETRVRLDTVFGELETLSQTDYVSSAYGVLCSMLSDDLKDYYDYNGETEGLLTFSAIPMEETLVAQTLGLQSATLAATSADRLRTTANRTTVFALPSSASVRAIVARAHARAASAFRARLLARRLP